MSGNVNVMRRSSLEDAVRVVAFGLASGGSIIRPVRKVLRVHAGDWLLNDLGLGAHLIKHNSLQAATTLQNIEFALLNHIGLTAHLKLLLRDSQDITIQPTLARQ